MCDRNKVILWVTLCFQDEIEINYMLQVFSKAKEEAEGGVINIDVFESVLKIAESIGICRSDNLVKFINAGKSPAYIINHYSRIETLWTMLYINRY